MAKRGRKPKIATVSDLDESLQLQVDEAILSHADESALSIFRRFGLAQRGINLGTFQKYAGTLRRENAGERMAEALERAATTPPAWEELDRLARVAAVTRLQAGDAKLYEIMLLSRARREEDELTLKQRAEERAAELHTAKMAELQKRLDAEKREADSKLDRMAVEKGIPGELAERIKDLYGVKVA